MSARLEYCSIVRCTHGSIERTARAHALAFTARVENTEPISVYIAKHGVIKLMLAARCARADPSEGRPCLVLVLFSRLHERERVRVSVQAVVCARARRDERTTQSLQGSHSVGRKKVLHSYRPLHACSRCMSVVPPPRSQERRVPLTYSSALLYCTLACKHRADTPTARSLRTLCDGRPIARPGRARSLVIDGTLPVHGHISRRP